MSAPSNKPELSTNDSEYGLHRVLIVIGLAVLTLIGYAAAWIGSAPPGLIMGLTPIAFLAALILLPFLLFGVLAMADAIRAAAHQWVKRYGTMTAATIIASKRCAGKDGFDFYFKGRYEFHAGGGQRRQGTFHSQSTDPLHWEAHIDYAKTFGVLEKAFAPGAPLDIYYLRWIPSMSVPILPTLYFVAVAEWADESDGQTGQRP